MKNWILIAAAIVLALAVAGMWLWAPRCAPGEHGIRIGGMLVAGCRE